MHGKEGEFMGVLSPPRIPALPMPPQAPAPPRFTELPSGQMEQRAREDARRRAASAMNIRNSMIAGNYGRRSMLGD